jgi:hypothetical protein
MSRHNNCICDFSSSSSSSSDSDCKESRKHQKKKCDKKKKHKVDPIIGAWTFQFTTIQVAGTVFGNIQFFEDGSVIGEDTNDVAAVATTGRLATVWSGQWKKVSSGNYQFWFFLTGSAPATVTSPTITATPPTPIGGFTPSPPYPTTITTNFVFPTFPVSRNKILCSIQVSGTSFSGSITVDQYSLADMTLSTPIAPVPFRSGTIVGAKPTPFVL